MDEEMQNCSVIFDPMSPFYHLLSRISEKSISCLDKAMWWRSRYNLLFECIQSFQKFTSLILWKCTRCCVLLNPSTDGITISLFLFSFTPLTSSSCFSCSFVIICLGSFFFHHRLLDAIGSLSTSSMLVSCATLVFYIYNRHVNLFYLE